MTGIGANGLGTSTGLAGSIRVEALRSRAPGGTGLGLSTARDVARAHGGDVRLFNREGGGLDAVLKLPAERRDGTPSAMAPV